MCPAPAVRQTQQPFFRQGKGQTVGARPLFLLLTTVFSLLIVPLNSPSAAPPPATPLLSIPLSFQDEAFSAHLQHPAEQQPPQEHDPATFPLSTCSHHSLPFQDEALSAHLQHLAEQQPPQEGNVRQRQQQQQQQRDAERAPRRVAAAAKAGRRSGISEQQAAVESQRHQQQR
eukprot:357152-Chlamydomonas_euryale.AAC.4